MFIKYTSKIFLERHNSFHAECLSSQSKVKFLVYFYFVTTTSFIDRKGVQMRLKKINSAKEDILKLAGVTRPQLAKKHI